MEFVIHGTQTKADGMVIDVDAYVHTGLGGLLHVSKIVDPSLPPKPASPKPAAPSTDPAGTLKGSTPSKTVPEAPKKLDIGGTLK
jgi:hypothetical protein